jgi:hypothetical protein
MSFPHLYECSVCGMAVKVTPQGDGIEPLKAFKCEHANAVIWANRKVTLRGKGQLNAVETATLKVTMTIRQFLSAITGRSV